MPPLVKHLPSVATVKLMWALLPYSPTQFLAPTQWGVIFKTPLRKNLNFYNLDINRKQTNPLRGSKNFLEK